MARLLITTVGTSLITNRDRDWGGWREGPLPDEGVVDEWLAQADPVTASAETNTLQAIGVQDSDHVLFLRSDTPEGRFCSERLESFYRNHVKCRAVDHRPLRAMGYVITGFSQEGLKALVQEAMRAVMAAREGSLQPVFCATGGFKAEIALLNLLGALLRIEVYYIHEKFRDIVRLPCLPLNWDTQWVQARQAFFEWIDEEPRKSSEVESWLTADTELRPLIEDNPDDGCSYLNAAGDLLFRLAKKEVGLGPRAMWPAAVPSPPDDKNGLSGVEHHRPQGWERFVSRLCEIDCVRRVCYDEAAYGGPRVKVLDGDNGAIAVRYAKGGKELPLRVETSACSATQTDLVKEYIARRR